MKILITAISIFALLPAAVAGDDLYHPERFHALTSDIRSFRVGDAITVLIIENSSAQSQANSSADKETSLSAGVNTTHLKDASAGLNLKRTNVGQGSTTRAGQIQAEISVRIQEVAANGDLVVQGSQKISVNGEVQRIMVSGVVRAIDVSSDNVVSSTRLTNSNIEYTGKGFVDRAQEESWISRFLGLLGL